MFRQAKKIVTFLLIFVILACSFSFGASAESWPAVFTAEKISQLFCQADRFDGSSDAINTNYTFRTSTAYTGYLNQFIKFYPESDDFSIYAYFPKFEYNTDSYYKIRIPLRFIVSNPTENSYISFFDISGTNHIVLQGEYQKTFTANGNTYVDYVYEGTVSSVQLDTLQYIDFCYGSAQSVLQFGIPVGDKATITLSGDLNSQYIVDNEKQNQENEKNEANSTGQEGVDEIGSLIPNDTEGLVTAFTNLTQSMIHNDTTCKLNFPGIKIPKLTVKGIEFGDVTLLEEQEIDFEYYFTLIPDIYLKLIRALCTIALVVYCFKEMYSLLSFIFTAKGGGDSE